jgi:hypothetical protein
MRRLVQHYADDCADQEQNPANTRPQIRQGILVVELTYPDIIVECSDTALLRTPHF